MFIVFYIIIKTPKTHKKQFVCQNCPRPAAALSKND